jgi:hypothetical protein
MVFSWQTIHRRGGFALVELNKVPAFKSLHIGENCIIEGGNGFLTLRVPCTYINTYTEGGVDMLAKMFKEVYGRNSCIVVSPVDQYTVYRVLIAEIDEEWRLEKLLGLVTAIDNLALEKSS